ncbi:hypothetical protein EWM64_g3664 [Hericium alpestre]|uniref:Uncharacterized protein n=1 Tax=Hericium alpestre TaxID=135208 RepID=A0A4Z0A1L7_9AGAM|nr:hypothetical protein EWM64_g3664 [Hericium alpestre]
MRDKVFGQGRRSGVPGRFNHVQWTLDGNERLVDRLGRTPEEAAEERGMPEVMDEDEDDEITEAQVMKPTWLLKFFESWGTRWRVSGGGGKAEEKPKVEGKAKPPEQKRKVQWVESPERAASASPPHLSLNDSD